ncbi:hypothetical protein C463_16422 [Halorubrum californiense DSM 19288]|uniref:SHOCT domain-containing protein n=1 Tax=Halorubrum californiense DSM 19288 TaxID=1227465 RepID=M0DZ84_9EURY|nr:MULTISPECIES: SHOCT domain-containing protein [Halorubrum]ELZ40103.1 hypothetical protein C463_16422 [Halorubrum californiense DSM 19288]TKX73180.1 SHOCT domain-containing protein [Halorubrum sp. GN11GM_10-3_MGM]
MADDETLRERFRRNASGIAATTVTGTWLAALLLGAEWWLGFMLFGYIVIIPVVSMLFDEEEAFETETVDSDSGSVRAERGTAAERDDETADTADALERLRTRYANGDLTDEQFERKVDRLLETETPEDAAEWTERNRSAAGGPAEREPDVERER